MTPSGSISLAQQNLAVSVADCASFRAWVKAGDREAALASIYHEGLPKPPEGQQAYTREDLVALRPFALVWTETKNGFGLTLSSFGSHAEYAAAGRLHLQLCQNCPDRLGDDPTSETNLAFRNFAGALLDELATLSGTAGYLCFQQAKSEGPFWTHPQLIASEGLYQVWDFTFDWKGS